MEQFNLKQIKLEDTGLYENEPKKNFLYSAFKKYKITTVAQVLDDDLMKQFSYRDRIYLYNEDELTGFRKLLKYKYLGIPMFNDYDLEKMYLDEYCCWRLGFSFYKLEKLKSIFEVLSQKKKNIRMLDILNEFVNSENWKKDDPVLYNVAKLNINSYNKSRNFIKDEYDTLLQLRVKLFSLIDERNNLDAQIEDIQQKIDALTNSKTEGGVSK